MEKDRTLSYIISRNYISLNQKDTGLAYYRDYLSRDKIPPGVTWTTPGF